MVRFTIYFLYLNLLCLIICSNQQIIYLPIIIWLIVIFVSLATTLALWSSTRQIYALATVGIVLVLSLPFLLFAFVTTLLNNIEFAPIEEEAVNRTSSRRNKVRKQ